MAKTSGSLAAGIFFLMILLTAPALAGKNSGAAFSTWPDTGQTECYDNSGEIPCPAAGQPFHGQDAQYNGPARSYTLLGGGTMVQDNVTGLVWEMKTSLDNTINYGNPHDADNTYTWCDPNPDTNGGDAGYCVEFNADNGQADTKDFIDQLNSGGGFGGYTDWRLPTIKELFTLVDWGRIYPTIDPIFVSIFVSTTRWSFNCWSSTTNAEYTDNAWYVDLDNGGDIFDDKSNGYYVRAVRGGQ